LKSGSFVDYVKYGGRVDIHNIDVNGVVEVDVFVSQGELESHWHSRVLLASRAVFGDVLKYSAVLWIAMAGAFEQVE
jgi:hypothetical protein